FIALVFLFLAASFLMNVWGEKREIIRHPLTNPEDFTKQPVREARLEPKVMQDGYMYRCNDCHDNIEPSTVQKSFFSAHSDIILDHGANNYCLTCHSINNREMLVDINKNEISFAQSHQTCLQCHGPIYRDWENGVHGRMNDFWDSNKGEVRKLTCVACHNPHQPKFQLMQPAPAPNIQNYRDFLEHLTIKEQSHE
ncbi:MAG: hypothetical protein KC684_06965, partial [Candidatus Omnitrophica bacterium]|nr:hypothetical protein [Candidatus Omnitrophota bacterium]